MAAKSADTMNMERREAKQRQRAVARARALHKQNAADFSLAEVRKERKESRQEQIKAERRAKMIAELSKKNQERLMADLQRLGAMVLQGPMEGIPMPDTDEIRWVIDPVHPEYRQWKHNCFDIITAARKHGRKYVWNGDWRETGTLTIAVRR